MRQHHGIVYATGFHFVLQLAHVAEKPVTAKHAPDRQKEKMIAIKSNVMLCLYIVRVYRDLFYFIYLVITSFTFDATISGEIKIVISC